MLWQKVKRISWDTVASRHVDYRSIHDWYGLFAMRTIKNKSIRNETLTDRKKAVSPETHFSGHDILSFFVTFFHPDCPRPPLHQSLSLLGNHVSWLAQVKVFFFWSWTIRVAEKESHYSFSGWCHSCTRYVFAYFTWLKYDVFSCVFANEK